MNAALDGADSRSLRDGRDPRIQVRRPDANVIDRVRGRPGGAENPRRREQDRRTEGAVFHGRGRFRPACFFPESGVATPGKSARNRPGFSSEKTIAAA